MFVIISYSAFMSCHFGVFTACSSYPVGLYLIPCVCVPKRKSLSIFHWSSLKAIHGWKKQLMGTSTEINAVMLILARIITDFCHLLPKALFSTTKLGSRWSSSHRQQLFLKSKIKIQSVCACKLLQRRTIMFKCIHIKFFITSLFCGVIVQFVLNGSQRYKYKCM